MSDRITVAGLVALLLLGLACGSSCTHGRGRGHGQGGAVTRAQCEPAPAEPRGHAVEDETRVPRAPAPPTLLRGATVWTAAGAVLPRTDVLLRGGRIAQVGRGLVAPAGARVIDGRGKHLTPGLIDPHSHLGVYGVPYLEAHLDGNEVAKPMSPAARAIDAFWPQDPAISLVLAAGVTTTLVVPGSANLVGGQGLVVKLVPGRAARDLLFPGAPPTVKMACGENPKRTYGEKGGPHSRMGSVARMRELLQQVVEYRRSWERFRIQERHWRERRDERCAGKQPAGADGGKDDGKQADLLPPAAPKRNLGLEPLVEVLTHRARVHWHCYRADEMLRMLALAREFGFQITAFHHATEAYKIRDVLRREQVATVTWVNWWGFKAEALDAIPEAVPLIAAAGGLVALHSDSPIVAQRLNHEAALAYYRGRALGLRLSEDEAIRWVTLDPARILGVDRQVGSIEVGKMADVVLWDGHPFSVYTRPEKVLVDGRVVFDRDARGGRRPTDFELQLVPRPAPLSGPARAAPPLGPEWVSPGGRRQGGQGGQGGQAGQAAQGGQAGQAAQGGQGGQAAPPLAIVGGTVHTMSGEPPRLATVLIQGGRIVGVGPTVNLPDDAQRLDARGLDVTPGLIAPETTLGLVEINAERAARDERPDDPRLPPVRAALRAADALNPASAAIAVTRIEGFTTALTRPYGGLVSGQSLAFDLDGVSERDTRLVTPLAIHANLGLSGGARGGSRAVALMRLRQLLEDARTLRRAQAAVEARRFRPLSASYADLVALRPVIERKLPLVVTVNRMADILAVLRLAREQQIRVVLADVAEGWRVADEIARARVPVLVTVDRNLPSSFDALAGRYDNAARLHHAGVHVALSAAGDAHDVRHLRHLAGIAAAHGLPRPAALAALTVEPAAIFGLADRGVLKVGALANVVVWTGDPLELSTRVKHLVIGGRVVPLLSRQTMLRDRYRTLSR